jgi:hypothetical protein
MDVKGDRPNLDSDWRGTWVITSGTGDLEGLQGKGIWWGPGWQGDPTECGVIYYSTVDIRMSFETWLDRLFGGRFGPLGD